MTETPVGQKPSLPQQVNPFGRRNPVCGIPAGSWDREESAALAEIVVESQDCEELRVRPLLPECIVTTVVFLADYGVQIC